MPVSLHLEDVADLVPQAALARRGVRLAVYAIAALLLLGAVWFTVDRMFLAPGRATQKVAQSSADAKAAGAVADTAKDATATGERVQVIRDRIERITRENTTRILAAEGADTPVPTDVDRAFMAALCVRDSYRGSDACDAVPGAAGAVGEGPDAGGGHPAS